MARRSLRPELNRIRAWVRQGRTDAWIAHQLEVTVQQIQAFKREQGLVTGEEPNGAPGDLEIDLRAEDDALLAAELEAAELEAERARAEAEAKAAQEPDSGSDEDDDDAPRTRPRRRRGGRGRRVLGSRSGAGNSGPLEGTFDHGEEGYGLWLDPAIQDNPIYAEHWAGHRPVEVAVEEDCIIIRRTAEDD